MTILSCHCERSEAIHLDFARLLTHAYPQQFLLLFAVFL